MTRIVIALLAVCLQAADIPKTWDDEAIASIEIPHPIREYSPVHVRSDFYYRCGCGRSTNYRFTRREGATGYIEGSNQPAWHSIRPAFEPSRIGSAGEIVFDAPLFEDTAGPFASRASRIR
jgi:hypothetical protein